MSLTYRLIPANQSRVRRLLRFFAPYDRFWMTYRLPFQREATVTYPPGTERPDVHPAVKHEEHHVAQFEPWYGPLLVGLAMIFPLPLLLSGRWFVERYAYLDDIRAGRRTVMQATETLWTAYFMPWPKAWMARWFAKQLLKSAT